MVPHSTRTSGGTRKHPAANRPGALSLRSAEWDRFTTRHSGDRSIGILPSATAICSRKRWARRYRGTTYARYNFFARTTGGMTPFYSGPYRAGSGWQPPHMTYDVNNQQKLIANHDNRRPHPECLDYINAKQQAA